MKKKLLLLLLLSTTRLMAQESVEISQVKDVVERSYANGAYNDLNTDAMRLGFHPEFEIYSPSGNQISRYPISAWIKNIENRKLDPDFDPTQYWYDYSFKSIDVAGEAAAVRIEFSKNNNPIYTDFILLLKFQSGWKIVSKVYQSHN